MDHELSTEATKLIDSALEVEKKEPSAHTPP